MNNPDDLRSPIIRAMGRILWAAVIVVPVSIFLTQGIGINSEGMGYLIFSLIWIVIILLIVATAFSQFTGRK